MTNWQGKHILIIGAARQGLALARFLLGQGAVVTLNDKRSPEQLAQEMQALQHANLTWVAGEHPLSALDGQEMVCLSGGVPLTLPIVVEAQNRGLPISNDSQIFMASVPARVIGITGSAGKTTTTTLLGRMAEAEVKQPRKSWLGGNIGLPLVEYLNEIHPQDTVILELSSFQLEQMTVSPHVAAVLNITPNHLDRHGSMHAYTAAKARILDYQSASDVAVLNRDDAGSWGLQERVKGSLVTFGLERPAKGQNGTYFAKGKLMLQDGAREIELMPQELIRLRGEHNLVNTLAACAIAYAAGFSIESMVAGVTGFTGVAHRLELVRTWHGAQWYNDSIATAPERAIAAIHSFNEPLVLMLGGRDKNLPYDNLAELIHQRVDHVVIFGEVAEKIVGSIGPVVNGRRPYTITRCAGLQQAVHAAAEVAEPGDVVLLSPSATSYDEFKDFEERGERYSEWVKQLS